MPTNYFMKQKRINHVYENLAFHYDYSCCTFHGARVLSWEYAHAANFVLSLIGFSALLISVLVETSPHRPRDRVTPEIAQITR